MSNFPDCFDALLRAWNEKDPSKIRGYLEAAVAFDVVFCDPNYRIAGIDAFEAMVNEFHTNFPVSTCEHTSGLDSHHNRYRYRWLVSIDGKLAIKGMDVTEVNDDGHIVRIDGFFGPFPELKTTK